MLHLELNFTLLPSFYFKNIVFLNLFLYLQKRMSNRLRWAGPLSPGLNSSSPNPSKPLVCPSRSACHQFAPYSPCRPWLLRCMPCAFCSKQKTFHYQVDFIAWRSVVAVAAAVLLRHLLKITVISHHQRCEQKTR